MEKLREINEGNAEIKNVYFGFENLFPTKNKNISDIPKKGRKGKKSKSKSKEKTQKNKNIFNQTQPIKNYNEFDNSNYKIKGSKYIQKPVKIIKTDEEREKEYFEEKNKKKKKSKKSKSKSKIKEEEVTENEKNDFFEVNNKKNKNISKNKIKEEENNENEENGNSTIKKKKKKAFNEGEEIIENVKPNKSKSKTKNKSKIKKKNKSKTKEEEREINENESDEEEIIISNKKKTKNKEKSKEKLNKSKTKKKKIKKKEREITESDENDNGNGNDNDTQNEDREKKKNKKNKAKSKEKSKSKSKSKGKTKKSSITKEEMEDNRTQIKIKKSSNMIVESIDMQPEFNEIKDDAMNVVDKHIQNLSLTFNDNKLKNNKNIKTINKTNKISMNNNFDLNDTIYKRPYTAHGYKAKSKTKRQIKSSRAINEEEKIMAFKEKVLVHDKVLSLFNNNLFQKNIKDEFSKTQKPKKSNSKHYMMPKQKDIIKQNKIKKKEIIYFNDKPEEDPDEIKNNEEDENDIKNKNNNAIKLMTSSKKYFTKSKQALNDIDKILTKENMDTFINNFMCKNNLNLEEGKSKTNYQNKPLPYTDISNIKYYHGGKTFYRPKSSNRLNPVDNTKNKLNNSDNNLKKYNKRYKIFNLNETISNPNNKFNFFSLTFTKQPIYGKYYNPPEVEDSFNNNISYIESNKWNGRYKLKKYTYEEKENPNDVYNYDYKYDDLNDDSDNELPSTNFKARTLPKYKKIDIEYKDNKTGKIVGGKNEDKIDNKLFQDNGDFNKAIYHPFLIDDDTVNI